MDAGNALIGNPKDEEGRFKEEAVQIGFSRLEDALGEYRAAHAEVRDELILEVLKLMDGEDEAAVERVLAEDFRTYTTFGRSLEKRCLPSGN